MRAGIRSSASLSFMSISSPKIEIKETVGLDSSEVKNIYCEAWDNHYWLVMEYIYSIVVSLSFSGGRAKSSDVAEDYHTLCQNYQDLSFNEELYFCYLNHNKIMTKMIKLIVKKKPIIEYYSQWQETVVQIATLYQQKYEKLQQERLVNLLKAYNLDLLNEIYNIVNDALNHDQKLNTYITIKTIADYINSTF